MGILKVRLVKATNLADKDFIGKTDPYVRLELEQDNYLFDKDYGYQVSSTKSNDLNPVWNEDFQFNNSRPAKHGPNLEGVRQGHWIEGRQMRTMQDQARKRGDHAFPKTYRENCRPEAPAEERQDCRRGIVPSLMATSEQKFLCCIMSQVSLPKK